MDDRTQPDAESPLLRDVPRFLEAAVALMRRYDAQTHTHLLSVGALSARLARVVGVVGQENEAVRWGGLLHDFGKIGISRALLNAPRPLTVEEWQIIKLHPESGASFVRERGEKVLANVIGAHHERIDGRGYPWGLAGKKIPLGARIIAVADAYDVLVTGRPYRAALTSEAALERIWDAAGTQFDLEIVEALIADIHAGGVLRDAG